MHRAIIVCLSLIVGGLSCAQAAEPAREPYGIGLEGFAYPYPVHLLPLVNDGEQVRMAYMDVAPAQPNGRTVVLMHGKNFCGATWDSSIKALSEAGYRVVEVPCELHHRVTAIVGEQEPSTQ